MHINITYTLNEMWKLVIFLTDNWRSEKLTLPNWFRRAKKKKKSTKNEKQKQNKKTHT